MSLLLPDGVDDRFIALRQFTALPERNTGNLGVFVKLNPVDQTRSETSIAAVERLADRGCGPDAVNPINVSGTRCREQHGTGTGESDGSRRTHHDLCANV